MFYHLHMKNWLALVLSLPTENAAARMRAWRSLKAAGAAVLRDGVYLLPAQDECRTTLAAIAEDVRDSGGTAFLLSTEGQEDDDFAALFDPARTGRSPRRSRHRGGRCRRAGRTRAGRAPSCGGRSRRSRCPPARRRRAARSAARTAAG